MFQSFSAASKYLSCFFRLFQPYGSLERQNPLLIFVCVCLIDNKFGFPAQIEWSVFSQNPREFYGTNFLEQSLVNASIIC